MRAWRVHPAQPGTLGPVARHAGRGCLALLLCTTGAGMALAAEDRFGFYGLSPAAAGQTVKEAEKALGVPLVAPPSQQGRSCQVRTSSAQPGVQYVVDKGVIVRIDTRDKRWSTMRGLRVGDSEARARELYGKRLQVSPHPYFERGHRLAVMSADRKHALVMESNDAGRIITLRGGRLPAVESLEGCP
jgi:hypothetical protein